MTDPTWDEVQTILGPRLWDQFPGGVEAWARRLGQPKPSPMDRAVLRREWWTHKQIGMRLDACARYVPGLKRVDGPPRRTDVPMLWLSMRGFHVLVDGRHRAKMWRDRPAKYEVIVVEFF